MRTCRKCGLTKQLHHYYVRNDTGNTMSICKRCAIKKTLQHRKDNPSMHRKYAKTQQKGFKNEDHNRYDA